MSHRMTNWKLLPACGTKVSKRRDNEGKRIEKEHSYIYAAILERVKESFSEDY